jgi:ABC-type transport system involved in multi-copper enzyme maturation permease subunit
MTTATVPAPARARSGGSFVDVLRSEWLKFRSVRSTFWTLLVVAALGIGLSALISLGASTSFDKQSLSDRLKWDPTAISTSGFALAQLAIGVLGVLIVTSEFSTGSIQTTLAAVPKRYPVLAAKGVVFGLAALVVAEILAFVAFFIGQAIIHANAPSAGIGDPHVLRAVVGAGLYVAVLAVLALAIGTIVRSAAAGIAILVALLYVLPLVAIALPSSLEHSVEKWWPTQAGAQITSVYRPAHTLSPWLGWGWMCLFTAIVMAVAVGLLRTRDV